MRGFRPAGSERFVAIKIFATGDSLRLSYSLKRRHSPFYMEQGGMSMLPVLVSVGKVSNMNQLISTTPGDHNHGCADMVNMAEHEFASFFKAMTELFGAEQAELSAEDWLRELDAISGLPSSTREWRRITVKVSTRVAARVNASSKSGTYQTAA
jgi:alkylhydroperoxidase/carboxymuconolactone decarboxylase family protein YurZ